MDWRNAAWFEGVSGMPRSRAARYPRAKYRARAFSFSLYASLKKDFTVTGAAGEAAAGVGSTMRIATANLRPVAMPQRALFQRSSPGLVNTEPTRARGFFSSSA